MDFRLPFDMNVDYQKLHYFTESLGPRRSWLRVGPDDLEALEALTSARMKPRKAVEFHRRSGTSSCDVIWTTFPPLVLISNRFADLLAKKGFRGWTTYPTRVYDGDEQLKGYAGLAVSGRAGAVDRTRCRVERRPPPNPRGSAYDVAVGLFFKNDEWDGSDVFMPADTGHIIVTEQVKNSLQTLHIPNVAFERLSDYETDLGPVSSKMR